MVSRVSGTKSTTYKRLLGFAVLTSLFAAASDVAQNQNRSVLTSQPRRNRWKRRWPTSFRSGSPDHTEEFECAADNQNSSRVPVQRTCEPRSDIRFALQQRVLSIVHSPAISRATLPYARPSHTTYRALFKSKRPVRFRTLPLKSSCVRFLSKAQNQRR